MIAALQQLASYLGGLGSFILTGLLVAVWVYWIIAVRSALRGDK